MYSYDEARFRANLDAALVRIRTVLDNTRNPQRPAEVPHTYEDKYLLAEFLTRTGVAATLQCLGGIGLTSDGVAQLRAWARNRSVTLRLRAEERCTFVREETRQEESPRQNVTEWKSPLGALTSRTEKVVTTIKEYIWRFEFQYEIVAFQGTGADQGVSLHARSGAFDIKTSAKTSPRPESVVRPNIDVNATWFFASLDEESRVAFSIDRTSSACHTPRRNPEIDMAMWSFSALYDWCARVSDYFTRTLFSAQPDHGRDLSAIHARDIFVPVVALLEAGRDGVVPTSSANAFLAEQRRSLGERCADLAKVFPRDQTAVTLVEATLAVTLLHAADVCQRYGDSIDHIEAMLRAQLIAAIGHEVTPADFAAYMDFHYRKLFKPEYRPQPFSYAIRRPDHAPEGALSIEVDTGDGPPSPITTTVTWREAARPMRFALDAATHVSFLGDRYVHAWVAHQFSGYSELSLQLVARARQFSSFILLVGRIASADTFEPRFGIILQNKDLLQIPLMLEQIPTPKEFRDAIESLSPEQQRFAKAFRAMQLESTLFGVCVIQIKPQLERVLNLSPDSLTKEIKLTQDLLSLFIEYQIPSDLISYDGRDDAPAPDKLARVKEHVAKMQEMISLSKKREIDEAREKESLRLAEMNRTPAMPLGAPPPAYGPPQPAPSMGGMGFPPSPPMMAPPPGAAAFGAPPPRPMAPPAPSVARAAAPPQPAPPPPMQGAPMPVVHTAPPPKEAPKPAKPATETTRAGDATPKPATVSQPSHASASDAGDGTDYTRIPERLDRRFDELDEDSALRPTIINPGDVWTRDSQKGLLSDVVTESLTDEEQETERNRAFDLLDALSRSGALTIDQASLHVVIAATHCFDKTLVDTVIQSNVNPIEKVERSAMIVATTLHDLPATELLADDQRARFFTTSPRFELPEGEVPQQPES